MPLLFVLRQRHLRALYSLLVGTTVLILAGMSASAQLAPRPIPPAQESSIEKDKDKDKDKDSLVFGSNESEMRAKLVIKENKKRYDENLARAKEASEIANQLWLVYEARKSFNHDDGKRLERLEKLTKRVRNEAGGSDNDGEAKDIPPTMEDVVKRVAEMAEGLRKEVEKTPRQVVSAEVIDQANKLISLIQYVRNPRP